MWTGDNDSDDLRSELQDAFRSISRVMNCVGCEKCKLWGKLQVCPHQRLMLCLLFLYPLSKKRLPAWRDPMVHRCTGDEPDSCLTHGNNNAEVPCCFASIMIIIVSTSKPLLRVPADVHVASLGSGPRCLEYQQL